MGRDYVPLPGDVVTLKGGDTLMTVEQVAASGKEAFHAHCVWHGTDGSPVSHSFRAIALRLEQRDEET